MCPVQGLRTRPLQRDYRPQGLMELLQQTTDVDDLMARAEEVRDSCARTSMGVEESGLTSLLGGVADSVGARGGGSCKAIDKRGEGEEGFEAK